MKRTSLAAASLMVLAACGQPGADGDVVPSATIAPPTTMPIAAPAAEPAAAERLAPLSARAQIMGGEGEAIGQATFTQGPTGVLIRMELSPGSLAPGWHGLHLHETGDCSDTGTFKLSGGHHGKADGAHGLLNADLGPEPGDLPNAWVAADGSAGYEAFSSLFQLGTALEGDGLALLIHIGPDDQTSQPIGGAGDRVACGVVRQDQP